MAAKRIFTLLGIVAFVFSIASCSVPIVSGKDSRTANIETDNIENGNQSLQSPLDEYLGDAIWQNQEAFEQARNRFNIRFQELVAECMLAEGFEYIPFPEQNTFTIADQNVDIHSNDREWVALHGFGIVSGHSGATGGLVWDQPPDPNDDLLQSLSESERAAYDLALTGPWDNLPGTINTQAEWDDWMGSRGCEGQSLVQARSENIIFLSATDEFAPLFDAIDEMRQTMTNTPVWLETNLDWANCMADPGHPNFATPTETSTSIRLQLISLQNRQQMSHLSLLELIAAGQIPEGTQIQETEIELALADLDCRELVDYDARVAAIRNEIETQFVNEHRAELMAYRDAAAQRE